MKQLNRPLRIAQIAPVVERVPAKKYGGTERVIYHLTEELVKMGHDVTLYASGDSLTSAKLVSVVDKPLREMEGVKDVYGFNTYSLMNVGLAYSHFKDYDIIHDHNPNLSLPIANLCQTPTVLTWHGPYDNQVNQLFSLLNKPYLVSISDSQRAPVPHLNFVGTVYNGLKMEHYPFSNENDGYLLYVGRIDAQKGVHYAMDTAIKLNRKLILAAKLDDTIPHIKAYFQRYVKPRLEKHKDLIEWVGEVDETQRNELMKRAYCFLHPVTWPEPFGLTLIEAMACGCPVVAFNQGSIPEVIINGKTGYVVNNLNEMVNAVKKIDKINRTDCRNHSIHRFNSRKMAQGYEEIYYQILHKSKKPLIYNPLITGEISPLTTIN